MYKRLVKWMILFALALCVAPGCNREDEPGEMRHVEEVALSVTPWPGSAALYVAQGKGYFRDEGIKAVFHPHGSGHLGLEAVLSRKVDFATVGDTPIARAALEGRPVAVIATLCEINRAVLIVARRDRGIWSAADLTGRKVGVVAGTTADFFLHIFLTTSYVKPSQVGIVPLETGEVVGALVRGDVDAVCTWSPHTIEAREKLGDNAVILEDPSLYKMTWNIVCTKELTDSRPALIRRVLRAIVSANTFITKQPVETRTVTRRNISAEGPLFEKEWAEYAFTASLNQSLILNLEDQARWMITKGIGVMKNPPNFVDLIYSEGLRSVKPTAVGMIRR